MTKGGIAERSESRSRTKTQTKTNSAPKNIIPPGEGGVMQQSAMQLTKHRPRNYEPHGFGGCARRYQITTRPAEISAARLAPPVPFRVVTEADPTVGVQVSSVLDPLAAPVKAPAPASAW